MLEGALAVGATLIALAATLSTFDRWLRRRRPYEVAWSTAFALFTIASGALAVGAGVGWTEPTFRIFYLFGAILNVPVLAAGTLMLHGTESTRRRTVVWVTLFSAFALGVVVTAPLTSPLPIDRLARGSEVLPIMPRLLAAVASGVATLIVVGGALRSAGRFRSVSGGGRRAGANLLIAAGVLITGASGLANSLLGDMGAFALFLAVGVAVIFVGYLVSTTGSGRGDITPGAAAASPLDDSNTDVELPPSHSAASAG
ncbi:MAG TPA: hypothetical protein VMY88_09430 [Acidimicrobiales bacterium]|nr:hypothetical protein [Acidimicrobiales bacterium]